MKSRTYYAGVALVVFSALVFSTAGLFAKGVDAGAWDIIFWRGIFAALLTTAFVAGRGTLRSEFVQMGPSGWAATIMSAAGSAAFIPAFKFTSIANVSLIYAISPLLAALLAWFWMKEKLSKIAAAGSFLSFVGVGIIVGGSLSQINIWGDLLALWMTLAMSAVIVIYRCYPSTPSGGPSALSSVLLLPFGLMFGVPFSNGIGEIAIMAAFGLVFALASITLAEGAKRLPSGETALLSILEAPFAPVLAWLILAEIPPDATFLGGALVLTAVVGSQLPGLKIQSSKQEI